MDNATPTEMNRNHKQRVLLPCPRCSRQLQKRDYTSHLAICCPYKLEPEAWYKGGEREIVAERLRSRYTGVELRVLELLLGLKSRSRSGNERERLKALDCSDVKEKEGSAERCNSGEKETEEQQGVVDIPSVVSVAKFAGWTEAKTLGFLHRAMQTLPLSPDPTVPIEVLSFETATEENDEEDVSPSSHALLLVNKPPGYEVNPSKRVAKGSMVNGVIAYVHQLWRKQEEAAAAGDTRRKGDRAAGLVEVHPVHRLDRDTSGCLCFALTKTAAKLLCSAFQQTEEAHKEYIAIVHGDVSEKYPLNREFTISDPVCEMIGDSSRRCIIPAQGARSQLAQTKMKVIAVGCVDTSLARSSRKSDGMEDSSGEKPPSPPQQGLKNTRKKISVIHARPFTGRTHQIRLHCAFSIGHPIIGDELYSGSDYEQSTRRTNEELGHEERDSAATTTSSTPRPLMSRQALHALRIRLYSPPSRKKKGETTTEESVSSRRQLLLSGNAPLPEDMLRLCHAANIDINTILLNS